MDEERISKYPAVFSKKRAVETEFQSLQPFTLLPTAILGNLAAAFMIVLRSHGDSRRRSSVLFGPLPRLPQKLPSRLLHRQLCHSPTERFEVKLRPYLERKAYPRQHP